MKQCPDRVIELFIRKVNVYEDKIEIFLNYLPNANITIAETISKELFTETFTSTRKFKGGKTKAIHSLSNNLNSDYTNIKKAYPKEYP